MRTALNFLGWVAWWVFIGLVAVSLAVVAVGCRVIVFVDKL